ncbi:MAG: aminotransferase class I/II-fold pyridoxal phosphate-dependent enzyme [Chitinophagales bacterium]|nr:aminotransferase class I/II-fold pyridoxal phosphate-dependent enzyme [Chitinophagales bacterium]
MREKLLQLEKISRQLDPPSGKRDEVRKKIIDYSENFLNRIENINAFNVHENADAGLLTFPINEEPIDVSLALSLLKNHVDTPGLNPASGGHLGYIPGGGIFYSALGDYLADVFNRYAGVYFGGPGAVRMENMLIKWVANVMGYPEDAGGNLTSGGSIANLIAVVCARDASKIKAREFEKAVIYMTKQVHHSVDKAIRIAGLKECIVRHVPMDENFKMKTGELANMIKADKMSRLHPLMIIASAGTTDTGAVDPLDEIAKIATKHELWFHVDAAYGGFFILTEEGKQKLKGIELSDSLAVDPHKGLFLPYGTGVVLVKDKNILNQSHFYQANYMQDSVSASDELSPADLSPELTKHFRGLRMWLPLKLHGVKPFRACLEEKLLLAKYFYAEVKKIGFSVGPPPELSVVTYRYIPKSGNSASFTDLSTKVLTKEEATAAENDFNKRLIEEIQKDGRVFISSTMIDGKFTLRAAILAHRTHLKTVDTLLEMLGEKVRVLEGKYL